MQRVLIVASEAYPLAKTGGLGDAVVGLGKALLQHGCDVKVLLPGYPHALGQVAGHATRIDLGEIADYGPVALIEGIIPHSDLPVWLIHNAPLYDRGGGLYLDADGRDWPDNPRRFALLARVGAAIALGETPCDWRPDIVSLNDWQAGPLAAILAHHDGPRPATVQTIHNLAFHGLADRAVLDDLGLPASTFSPDGLEFWGKVSFLKAGIRYADRVTTVSETYARDILTEEFGCGLDGTLRARPETVTGIRNGVDADEWNPARDSHIAAAYDPADLTGKTICKAAVRDAFRLDDDPGLPVIAYLCRLTEQKMADVILDALPDLAARGVHTIVMGRGSPAIEAAFDAAAGRFPGRVGLCIGYDEARAHLLLSGADMLLAPARFEPCGLTQMYAMRYGAVPIASRVGGLSETITDLAPELPGVGDATGFLFDGISVADITAAVDRALACYRQPLLWRRLMVNGMRRDFSWSASARRYRELFDTLRADTPRDVRRPAPRARAEKRPAAM